MIFVFGFLLCISLATAVVCASSDSSTNETLLIPPVAMTSCDNVHECRTLSAIVYGCLATIFACVWVAMHPNIPCVPNPLDERHKLSVWVNYKLSSMIATLFGIILPEMLLFTASQQWLNARQVARDLRGITISGLDDPESNPSENRREGGRGK
ncbi:hypothetical protein FIBSPDRAFT_932106 [Athelia psychrophila]|uniref:Uncharacterized protein n=1 Tax=Athelia psychrophila TaxID=1759441 RepID=A0A166J9J3_9AGAM|nr:hypothetical protein FIBSPDRAFT_932106 [Fibularhizoctonia sp. CBS 109695]